MPKDKEEKPKKAKKPSRKSEIHSAKFFERRALACNQTAGEPEHQDCGSGFFS